METRKVTAWPLLIELPEPGNYPHIVRAHYVPNSDPPAYRLDAIGMDLPIDVVIPNDLAAAGWYWHGSLLSWPASDPLRPQGISTATYPPPGWPSTHEDCFTLARQSERRRAEWHAQRVATAVARETRTRLPRPTKQEAPAPAPVPATIQMELF